MLDVADRLWRTWVGAAAADGQAAKGEGGDVNVGREVGAVGAVAVALGEFVNELGEGESVGCFDGDDHAWAKKETESARFFEGYVGV